ncbi:MAG: hypothetical protein E4G91_03335 [Candidatus Zixiibacteriota bacterium]|nr:MAG: hypothetical protein E4G91_03335 [candidate division Zixibacteria bacterium]
MKLSWTTLGVSTMVMSILLLNSCSSDQKQQKAVGQRADAAAQWATSGAVAGVEWKVPPEWPKGGEKPMRAATYTVGSGDALAECAVFFFGTGQGGDVEANIARWILQVRQPDGSDSKAKAVRAEVKSACCLITTVEVAGTYMASAGLMMQEMAEKPGFVLLGGIVPGPQGNVFFKLTGPKATVDKVKEDFQAMLRSVSKQAD